MIPIFVSLLILLPTFVLAQTPFKITPEKPLSVDLPSSEVSIEVNPFIYKCPGTDPLPQIQKPRVSFDRTAEGTTIATFAFQADAEPYLVTRDGILPLSAAADGVFHVSVVHPEVKSFFHLFLKTQAGRVRYRFDAYPARQTGSVRVDLTKKQKSEICLRNQIWAGVGISMFAYQQQILNINANTKFTSMTHGSFHLEGRWYPSRHLGLFASYKNAPGVLDKGNVQGIDKTDFSWQVTEIGAQIRKPKWFWETGGLIVYPYLRASLEHHRMPRLGATKDETLFFEELQFVDGTVGAGANIFTSKNYFFEIYLNAKTTLLDQGSKVRSNGVPFSGAIGMGRSLNDHFMIGAYWYGHAEKLTYQSEQARDPNPGQLDLFFSSFDLRLGYMF